MVNCEPLQTFLAALVVKTVIFMLQHILPFWKTSPTKLERLSIPNLDLSENMGKVVIK